MRQIVEKLNLVLSLRLKVLNLLLHILLGALSGRFILIVPVVVISTKWASFLRLTAISLFMVHQETG